MVKESAPMPTGKGTQDREEAMDTQTVTATIRRLIPKELRPPAALGCEAESNGVAPAATAARSP